MRILAVDDEPYIRELMPLLAARVGFPDVTTACSGAEALDALGVASYDCLVLDINMPGMDGIELCRLVRALPSYRKTPIIMLTAMSEREFMEQAFKVGATDYVTKPFDIKELGARLRVSQELMLARRAADAGPAGPINLADVFDIDGVDRVLDFAAFQNYLKQTSRSGLAASQIFAVKIDRAATIFRRAKPDEFIYALREVAFALTQTLRMQDCLLSYAGQGVFVVVSNSATPLDAAGTESDVQQTLDERNAAYDDGAPMDIEVSVGGSIQPGFGDPADCLRVLERAIARADARTEAKAGQVRPVSIRQILP